MFWGGLGLTKTLRRFAEVGLTIWMLLRLLREGCRLGSLPSVSRIRGTGEFDTSCYYGLDGLRYFVVL